MPNNYILLETIALTQSAASVTFDNLPTSGYTDLKIVISSRTNRASAVDSLGFYFNGDTTVARYTGRVLYGTGTAAVSNAPNPVNDETMFTSGNSATASTFGNAELYIPNYRSSNQKSVSIDSVGENNATTARMNIAAVLYDQTTAISSITFIPITGTTILANSTFSLYGIAAFGTTPVLAPKATGGNIVANDGTYWYHAFTSSGFFTPQVGLTCDYLVVAGGGGGGGTGNGSGGGYAGGGGAGAGGLRSTVTATGGGGSLESAISLVSSTAYAITIGAGGAGGLYLSSTSGNGSNSSIASTVVSTGGGGLAAGVGQNGGSGGGSYDTAAGYAVGSGTSGQGYAGGANGSGDGGTAGGGAGARGGTVSGNAGSAGGVGVAISSFATATNTGVSNYYAGGGGGGGYSTNGGAGGAGGGAAGGTTGADPSNAIANTGGGGGGATQRSTTTGLTGSNGGSGIVIIRYPIA